MKESKYPNIISTPNYGRLIGKKIKYFFRRFKYIYQRSTKGYCDIDIWNLYHFYGEIFSSSIKELKDNLHGYPLDMTEEEWDEYLEKMSRLFYNITHEEEVYKNPYWDLYYYKVFENKENKNIPAIKELYKKFLETEEENKKKIERDKNEAFKMLSDRFFNLWD